MNSISRAALLSAAQSAQRRVTVHVAHLRELIAEEQESAQDRASLATCLLGARTDGDAKHLALQAADARYAKLLSANDALVMRQEMGDIARNLAVEQADHARAAVEKLEAKAKVAGRWSIHGFMNGIVVGLMASVALRLVIHV